MQKTTLSDGWYCLEKAFLSADQAEKYFKVLLESCKFKSHKIKIFGKEYNTPREESFHSKSQKHYRYSGFALHTNPYLPVLSEMEEQLTEFTKSNFNSVLINLYRNENDSNGWHADDEKELGQNPLIASLSLGATRRFELKHKERKEKIRLHLEHGDLLVMGGSLQHHWKHQIPKERNHCPPRINLTFRNIF